MNEKRKNSCKHIGGMNFRAVWSDFCAVAPSPELKERIKAEMANVGKSQSPLLQALGFRRAPQRLGFDDGVIIPPDHYPIGTPYSRVRAAAAERAPLRGTVRVIVVLVQFSDKQLGQTASHFKDLFFSTGVLPHGSIKEYYREVTAGLVDISGEVAGPYQLPQTLAWYANNNYGIGKPSGTARANIMAQDAAVAADPDVDFSKYDNDGNGYVDAFIVVHAGMGGEATGNPNDIWSHKWTLPSTYNADGKSIYGYLTIPEDARIGVGAHELGHLLFGFPDLYDVDYTSEGIGNWCLMAAGSWNGGGDVPAHPSAWCKVQQGWATVTNVTTNGSISIPDVKTSRNVHRLWKSGSGGPEYFLIENRQRTGYDADLPGDGLLIWHIDENQPDNSNENHYEVALMQADGKRDLELDHNRGDAGDPYPGSSGNTAINANSNPNSKSYAGQDSCVSVTGISASGPTMTATVAVQCGKAVAKDLKDSKDRKEARKEARKERKDHLKDRFKDTKEIVKERKDAKDRIKDRKEVAKENKEIAKESKDLKDHVEVKTHETGMGTGQAGFGAAAMPDLEQMVTELEARVAALEAAMGSGGEAEPFIGSDLRPDLIGGPDYGNQGNLEQRMAAGDRDAKIAFDTLPS